MAALGQKQPVDVSNQDGISNMEACRLCVRNSEVHVEYVTQKHALLDLQINFSTKNQSPRELRRASDKHAINTKRAHSVCCERDAYAKIAQSYGCMELTEFVRRPTYILSSPFQAAAEVIISIVAARIAIRIYIMEVTQHRMFPVCE